MSYILDALKKSERQRPPGPVPDLFTVHGPQPPSPRRPARALVIAALLLLVTAAALGVWFGRGARDEEAARFPVAVSPQSSSEAPFAPATPPRAAVPMTAPAPARAPAAAAAPRPVGERPQSPAPTVRKSPEAAAASLVAAAPPPASLAAPPVPAAPAPVAAPAGEIPSTAVPATPPVGAPETAAAVSAPEPVPPADGRVLDLSELPAAVRAELPKLVVSGHVWSEEPALRLLGVDDRLLHEGGEAAPGVSLREITPSGAVFVFKGWHFRVAGGRP